MGRWFRRDDREARMLEAVADRVHARILAREEERRWKREEKAETDALVEVSGLSREEVKQIAKEVRLEFKTRRRRLAWVVVISMGAVLAAGVITVIHFFGIPFQSGIPLPDRVIPANSGPEDESSTEYFIRAVEIGDFEYAEAWLEHGVPIDASSKDGTTALIAASATGNLTAVRFLLQEGAAVDVRDHRGLDAIDHALLNGHTPAVSILNRHLIQESQPGSVERRLWAANIPFSRLSFLTSAEEGDAEAVRLFLEAGYDTGFRGPEGETALEKAVKGGHVQTAQILLEERYPDSLLQRLREVCEESGDTEMVQVLERRR
jgi:hypothetical protein